MVVSTGAHFGEEPVLVGPGGSGTIFFAGCNLDCVFCQNHDISHPHSMSTAGREVPPAQLAALALGLQADGCTNVNFVTPTHVAHAVAEAVVLARRRGLTIPVVYNCGGYESVETLERLEGLVDIYMPDIKYSDAQAGLKYSGVPDYPAVAEAALQEMHRQVGPLVLGDDRLALRGMLVRHLVMPDDLSGGQAALNTIARVAPGAGVNIMGQYRPTYRAVEHRELVGSAPPGVVDSLRSRAVDLGLQRVD